MFIRELIHWLLFAYWIILLVRVLSTWFPAPMGGPMRTIMGWIYDVTEPVLRPFGRLLPPVRMGAMALDLSPILVFIVLGILLRYV